MFFSSFISAQNSDESFIKATTVNGLFEGMKISDSSKTSNTFTKNAILQTITKTGDAKTENIKAFAISISKTEKGSLEERIIFSKILIESNLASVWTLYEFYNQGKLSHCGVNSFQLIKINTEWKIQYIINRKRKDQCAKK